MMSICNLLAIQNMNFISDVTTLQTCCSSKSWRRRQTGNWSTIKDLAYTLVLALFTWLWRFSQPVNCYWYFGVIINFWKGHGNRLYRDAAPWPWTHLCDTLAQVDWGIYSGWFWADKWFPGHQLVSAEPEAATSEPRLCFSHHSAIIPYFKLP